MSRAWDWWRELVIEFFALARLGRLARIRAHAGRPLKDEPDWMVGWIVRSYYGRWEGSRISWSLFDAALQELRLRRERRGNAAT